MKNNHKILIIIVLLAVTTVGYYGYTQYNTLKTQEYLKTSHDLKGNATTCFDQATDYEDAGNYGNAIAMYQKSDEEFRKALNNNRQALKYAGGVYREYLDKDIQLLEKTIQLIEYKVYLNQYRNNSLNPGQEKVTPTMLTPYINDLTRDVASIEEEEKQVINGNPEAFTFLNQGQ